MIAIILQLALFLIILIALAVTLGNYISNVIEGKNTFLSCILKPIETFLYKFFKVDEDAQMDSKHYIVSVLLFSVIGFIFLFVLLLLQKFLPLNPQHFNGVNWATAINTTVSFVTNTNWQSYSGEETLSYLSQMLGLSLQNFLSAAVGLAVVMAFMRGFARKSTDKIGNFWVDLTRSIIYIVAVKHFIFSYVYC